MERTSAALARVSRCRQYELNDPNGKEFQELATAIEKCLNANRQSTPVIPQHDSPTNQEAADNTQRRTPGGGRGASGGGALGADRGRGGDNKGRRTPALTTRTAPGVPDPADMGRGGDEYREGGEPNPPPTNEEALNQYIQQVNAAYVDAVAQDNDRKWDTYAEAFKPLIAAHAQKQERPELQHVVDELIFKATEEHMKSKFQVDDAKMGDLGEVIQKYWDNGCHEIPALTQALEADNAMKAGSGIRDTRTITRQPQDPNLTQHFWQRFDGTLGSLKPQTWTDYGIYTAAAAGVSWLGYKIFGGGDVTDDENTSYVDTGKELKDYVTVKNGLVAGVVVAAAVAAKTLLCTKESSESEGESSGNIFRSTNNGKKHHKESFWKRNQTIIIIAGVGLIALVLGIAVWYVKCRRPREERIPWQINNV